MVTRLNEDEMKELMEKMNTGDDSINWTAIHLGNIVVQRWIADGKFKHVKNELSLYHSVKFGCVKTENKCSYVFFGPKPAIRRIGNFLNAMIDNKIEHITSFPNNRIYLSNHTTTAPIYGTPNACPLF